MIGRALDNGSPIVARNILLKEAEANRANSAEAYFQVGNIAESDGDLRDAYNNYQAAAQLKPSELKYIETYQATCYRLGKYSEAHKLLEKLSEIMVAKGTLDAEGQQKLDVGHAAIFLQQAKLPQAEELYLKAKRYAEGTPTYSKGKS